MRFPEEKEEGDKHTWSRCFQQRQENRGTNFPRGKRCTVTDGYAVFTLEAVCLPRDTSGRFRISISRGGEGRRSVSMRQVCMGIREGGREEERFARKFVTLGWNILEGQVLKFREVRLGYGLETVCWTFFSREEMTYEIIIFLWSLWELHRNVNINLLYSTYK